MKGFLARSNNPIRFREHFMYRHLKTNIYILNEVPSPLPRFNNCLMHIPEAIMERHKHTDRFNRATEMWM